MQLALLAWCSLWAIAQASVGKRAVFTPHVQFASSAGVLGCKININRVGYLPTFPGCDNMCVRIRNPVTDFQLTVLHVDQSQGAHDISADAFAFLITGKGALGQTVPSDPTEMEYSVVPMEQCHEHIHTEGNKMPIIAVNPNAVVNCMQNSPRSWLARNHVLLNYANSCCTLGSETVCSFPSPYYGGAQPVCEKGVLGLQTPCKTQAMNIDMQGVEAPAVC